MIKIIFNHSCLCSLMVPWRILCCWTFKCCNHSIFHTVASYLLYNDSKTKQMLSLVVLKFVFLIFNVSSVDIMLNSLKSIPIQLIFEILYCCLYWIIIKAVTFHWKYSFVEYGNKWKRSFRLCSLCLYQINEILFESFFDIFIW